MARLRLEEGKSLQEICERLGVKNDATNCRVGKALLNRGSHLMINVVFGIEKFNSLEEENTYLKELVEY